MQIFYTSSQINANFQSILSMNQYYYTKANCDAQYYLRNEIDSKLTGYYTKVQVENKLPTSLIYKANDVNYIVAGDNTQNQLQFLYKGANIMDLDAGALTCLLYTSPSPRD